MVSLFLNITKVLPYLLGEPLFTWTLGTPTLARVEKKSLKYSNCYKYTTLPSIENSSQQYDTKVLDPSLKLRLYSFLYKNNPVSHGFLPHLVPVLLGLSIIFNNYF